MPNDLTTILTIDDAFDKLKQLEIAIKSRDLRPDVTLRIMWCGSDFHLVVSASEAYDANGYWSREFSCGGHIPEVAKAIADAEIWVFNLPSPEQRAISMAVQWLNDAIGKLPKSSANAVQEEICERIAGLLRQEAERLAHNILPHTVDTPVTPAADDDEIPF